MARTRINTTHGMSETPEYAAWYHMLQRCRNPKSKGWKNYGGRGISVHFKNFEEFFAEVGFKPSPKHSIDRWPNNETGHYEPGNVRWATWNEQAKNRRKRKRKTHCRYGHEFTPENSYLDKNGNRTCKECARQRYDAKRATTRQLGESRS